jgi:DNA replicative helicase MCM subunit Mcm2 (Cdc46/Mcm family)
MTQATTPTLAQLWNASHVCSDCGSTWGRPRDGCRTSWQDTCQICGQQGRVTHVRNYGWLQRGIAIIERQQSSTHASQAS